MTQATIPKPRRAAIFAPAMAALLLAGCSTGHIGESWQCPLAEGGACESVAAADPAVPTPKAAGTTVLAEPLWRVRAGDRTAPSPERAAACGTDCGGFDPFGWLVRLFDGGGDEAPRARTEPAPADAAAPSPIPSDETGPPAAAPATALLPAAPEPVEEDPHADDLRTDEVVARIWIAPFVDAVGVYREASHVRVVLEPAGWRLR